MDVRVTAKGPGAGRLQRPPRIDVRALTDPHNREKVSQILEDAPRPAWEVSAHSHVAIVTSYLQDRLTAAFPQQARRPFKPILLRTHGLCRSRSLGANALPLRLPCVDRPSVPCYGLGGRVAQQVLLLPLPGCVSGRLQRRYTVSGLESLLSPCATVARKIEQPM